MTSAPNWYSEGRSDDERAELSQLARAGQSGDRSGSSVHFFRAGMEVLQPHGEWILSSAMIIITLSQSAIGSGHHVTPAADATGQCAAYDSLAGNSFSIVLSINHIKQFNRKSTF